MINQSLSTIKNERNTKKCFVISPIGDEGSEVRKRADQVLNYIIKPITEDRYSYETTRADDIPHPGMITPQILDRLLHDHLVIADLTGSNPNVTYELAIRHMIGKPFIQIKDSSDPLPFDISGVRTISFDYRYMESMDRCKDEISKQIDAIEKNPSKVDSPITHAMNLLALKASDEPFNSVIQQMLSDMQMIKTKIANLEGRTFPQLFVRRDEALSPFSGGSGVTVSGQVRLNPEQLLGNIIFDPAGKTGGIVRLKSSAKNSESENER